MAAILRQFLHDRRVIRSSVAEAGINFRTDQLTSRHEDTILMDAISSLSMILHNI